MSWDLGQDVPIWKNFMQKHFGLIFSFPISCRACQALKGGEGVVRGNSRPKGCF